MLLAPVLLERACKIQVGIMNGTPNKPHQQAIDMMQQTFNNKDSWEGLGGVAWPSMRRLADRWIQAINNNYLRSGNKCLSSR